MKMLLAVATLMLTLAIFHITSYRQPNGWTLTKFLVFGGNRGKGGSAVDSNVGAVDTGNSKAGGSQLRSSLEEHMRLAEANWAKTVKQRHEMIKMDYGNVREMPLFPVTGEIEYYFHPYTVWDFTPASYGCPHEMERVGRMGDGGKWVCGMSRYERLSGEKPCIIYSFGIRDESSFENAMLSRTQCELFAYDFSVMNFTRQLDPENWQRVHFMQVGISGKTDTDKIPPYYSIHDLMKMNGHDYMDILKMDIEGAEFESMGAFEASFPKVKGYELPIGQLMMEVHLFDGMTAEKYLTWWERLESRGLRPTWTEPNLLAVTMNLSGDKAPILAEYTLLNVHDRRNVLFEGVRVD